jgi:hypothetical protein
MKTRYLLGILLFSGLWGLAEAVVGGTLYAAGAQQAASILLAVIAFGLLTAARATVPLAGSSAAIAALAMLYKFLNEPFFACHLLGIFLLGAAYEVVFALARGRYKPLIGAAGTYLGFAAFAVLITYVFRYSWWADEGWPKVLRYVVVTGTIAAACNAVVVPLADRLARGLGRRSADRAELRKWAVPALSVVAAGVWVFALVQPL